MKALHIIAYWRRLFTNGYRSGIIKQCWDHQIVKQDIYSWQKTALIVHQMWYTIHMHFEERIMPVVATGKKTIITEPFRKGLNDESLSLLGKRSASCKTLQIINAYTDNFYFTTEACGMKTTQESTSEDDDRNER